MTSPLSTYLHDHLAGATLAIELLEHMRRQHHADFVGAFASELLLDIEMDRTSLQQIAIRFGEPSNVVKEAAAWLGEKVSRLKLSDAWVVGFGTFETLEFLQLGIEGKAALWRALEVASKSDDRLAATDFAHLLSQAEQQVQRVEQQRLELAAMRLQNRSRKSAIPQSAGGRLRRTSCFRLADRFGGCGFRTFRTGGRLRQ